MSTPPIRLLLVLAPFVDLLGKLAIDQLKPMIAEAIDKDRVGDSAGGLTCTPEEAIACGVEHLVPLREKYESRTVNELREEVKVGFGLKGHSKSPKKKLIPLLIKVGLEETARKLHLDEEDVERTAAATAVVTKATAEIEDKPKTPKATPKPKDKPMATKPQRPKPHEVKEIRVLVRFPYPTEAKVKNETKKTAADMSVSLYRGDLGQGLYRYALACDAKSPGWFDKHVEIVSVHR